MGRTKEPGWRDKKQPDPHIIKHTKVFVRLRASAIWHIFQKKGQSPNKDPNPWKNQKTY